jgi:hypothetical protein
VRQPHRLFNLGVALIFPDQQIGDFSRIVEIAPHKPRGDDGHVLAVEPRPGPNEVLMSAPRLSLSLIHRLIPVTIVSWKVPLTGCIFKESVKICTPKSPPFSYDFAPDFTTFYVFPHCSIAQPQHFGRLA